MKYIYCFTNLINGKRYIGSTINEPQRRYTQHIYHVRHQTDKSAYPLYAAIRKYGEENFRFEILLEIECSEEELRKIEYDYIQNYNTISPNGYNQTDDTSHPINSPETYAKVRETKRNKAKEIAMLDLEGNILSIYRSAIDCAEANNLDQKKITACCRGERHSHNGFMFKFIDKDGNLEDRKYSRDNYKGASGTTQIQSSSRKVAKIDPKTNQIIDTYDTIALAGRENNCDQSGISKVCNGKRKTCKGFIWRYIDG